MNKKRREFEDAIDSMEEASEKLDEVLNCWVILCRINVKNYV